jgi:hypothetical protein
VGRGSRWIIFVPVALLALWSSVAKADGLGDWTASQSCATGNVNVVDNSIVLTGPDGGGCGGPNWVKIETTIPEGVFSVSFDWSYWTNDGWVYDPPQYGVNNVYTLLTQQNQASGTKTVTVTAGDIFAFRQYSIDSCCQAGHLTISNLSLWEFTTTSTTSTTMTTTTIVPVTTVLATSTTSTTVPETSTSSTTTTTSTTTSTTTTTIAPTTTTTTSSVPKTTTTESTTTTTQAPAVPTPVTQPQISEPEPVEPSVPEEPEEVPTGTTSTTVEEAMPEVTLPEETTTTVEEETTTTEPETITTETPEDTTTTVEPDLEPNLEPLAEEEVQALVAEATTIEELQEIFEELTPEQVEQVVDEILSQEEPSQEQAVALATSPEVLSVISVDNAEKVFEALQVDELTVEQVSELIEAVQSAPEDIRTQFETSIDIFASDLGDYVPVGSNVPVDTRRTLIAVAAGAAMAAVGSRKFP